MDPAAQLTLSNTIPQCQVCNQVYQDRYIFDVKGRAVAVASVEPVKGARPETKKQILAYLK
ncbi:MAG: hypothetical protein ABL907_21360 [Hyphomicrobium sp.]